MVGCTHPQCLHQAGCVLSCCQAGTEAEVTIAACLHLQLQLLPWVSVLPWIKEVLWAAYMILSGTC